MSLPLHVIHFHVEYAYYSATAKKSSAWDNRPNSVVPRSNDQFLCVYLTVKHHFEPSWNGIQVAREKSHLGWCDLTRLNPAADLLPKRNGDFRPQKTVTKDEFPRRVP